MGEYISRETVLKELGKNSITKRITLADGVSIYDTIHNIPTADVVEVKHGRWLDTGSFDHHKTPIYQCSVCRKEVADGYIQFHKYCLHCGAKMDGNNLSTIPTDSEGRDA